ncbi:MAG: hypothetical protein IT320_26980 [Anaerolineae bacterium]|nr:hypothetical protein [Anaerolineae bacterium]
MTVDASDVHALHGVCRIPLNALIGRGTGVGNLRVPYEYDDDGEHNPDCDDNTEPAQHPESTLSNDLIVNSFTIRNVIVHRFFRLSAPNHGWNGEISVIGEIAFVLLGNPADRSYGRRESRAISTGSL